MRSQLLLVSLLATLLGAAAAPAGEPRVGRFTRYDTGSYVIVTSRGAPQAKRFVENLVQFRMTLERVLGKRATPNTLPATILITNGADWEKWLQPRQNVAGYFLRAHFSNNMALNGDATLGEALHIMFHEYTHYYLASQFAGEYPPWFNEGLAELMGYARFDKDMAVLRIPLERVSQARSGDWIPFERLIRVGPTDPEYQSHELAPSFYAQSWLAVQYGLVENPEFGAQIFKYLNQLNTLVPQDQAAQKSFGDDLAAIDRQLREYLRTSDRHSGGIKLGEVPAVQFPEGVPLDEFEAMATISDFMLDSRGNSDRVRPLIESLARRDKNVARAAILEARLALQEDDNEAFDRAVTRAEGALQPGDWEQRRELASVLLASGMETNVLSTRKSEDTKKDLVRAMKWFGEAITHNNGDVEALWGFGTAASRLDRNLDLAEQALISAYRRAPSSAEIAGSLADLKGRQLKHDEMLPYLKDVIRYATDLDMRRQATEAYMDMQKYIAERDQVAAENRKRREEYEKQVAEYEKKRGKAVQKK